VDIYGKNGYGSIAAASIYNIHVKVVNFIPGSLSFCVVDVRMKILQTLACAKKKETDNTFLLRLASPIDVKHRGYGIIMI
jgi:hypothetical protein